ncbi:MAG: hypothetical protein HGA75_16040, partial [Thiobacillus sp.]|nr:hypothetical protein [Thiobacillus sp.]
DTTLTGTNTGSTYTISAANSGDVDGTITFSGVTDLTGGSGVDTYIFSGVSPSLSGALTDTGGATNLNSSITAGSVDLAGAVVLGADLTVTATNGSIAFGSTITGNHALTADADATAAGTVTFGGAVGASGAGNQLTALTVKAGSAGDIVLPVVYADSLDVSAGGDVTDSGNLTVTNNAKFAGASITLDAAANNFGTLTFVSAGDVDITEQSTMNIVGANSANNLVLESTTGNVDAYYQEYSSWTSSGATLDIAGTTEITAAGWVYSGSAYNDRFGDTVSIQAGQGIYLYSPNDIKLGHLGVAAGQWIQVSSGGAITNGLAPGEVNIDAPFVNGFGGGAYLYGQNGIAPDAVAGGKDPAKGIYFSDATKQVYIGLGASSQGAATFTTSAMVEDMGDGVMPVTETNGQVVLFSSEPPGPGVTPSPIGAVRSNQLFLCSLSPSQCTDAFTGQIFGTDISGILNAAAQDLFNSTFGTDNIRVAIQNGFLTQFGVVPPGIDAINGEGVMLPGASQALVIDPPPFLIDEEELKRRATPK